MDKAEELLTKLLKDKKPGLVVSIYLPTHPKSTPDNLTADQIRFKNAIKRVRHHVNYNGTELDKALEQLDDLLANLTFWKYQDHGLAVFCSAQGVDYFKLPFEVEEAEYITDHYVVSPLIIMEAASTRFYVLDLNFTTPRLFLGAHSELADIGQDKMPLSLSDEVGKDEYSKHLQHHPGGDYAFHGHSPEDTVSEEARRYLKKVASAVDKLLVGHHSPLLLAGTPNRTGNLRSLLTYKNILPSSYEGSAERFNPTELYSASAKLLQEYFNGRQETSVSRLASAAPKFVAVGLSEITELATSAGGASIESLYLPAYRLTKDSVQPGDNTSLVIDLPDDIETVEPLVTTIKQQGGQIIPVEIGAYDFLDQPKALRRY
ncbi:MAG: hypothetical protein ABI220_01285 [Candidatus Saccharimonadales bacterium]